MTKQAKIQNPDRAKPKGRVMKGSREFVHDLFKMLPAKFKQNKSITPGQPSLIELEHSHYFHSFDSRGRPQKVSSTMGGHWHPIEWEIVDGTPVAKCGPPVKNNYRRIRGRVKKVAGPIKFRRENDLGDSEYVTDDHTHEIEYVHSEHLSPDKLKSDQQSMANALAKALQASGGAQGVSESGLRSQASEGFELSGL